jgi:ankyrin repeat protein
MKPTKKLFCLILALMFIAVGCKMKEPEPPYKMTEEEAKVLAETKAYLKARGQVDTVDDRGETRLHKAAKLGYKTVAELLITNGADLAIKGGPQRLTPLHVAAFEGHKEVVKLLIDNGADANARGIGELRPLHFAAGRGRRDVVEFLLAKGADPKAKVENRKTAVHLAASGGHQDIAELLLRRGCDVNARDVEGMTPLHAAISEGHESVTEFLILKGADLNATAGEGWTPLHLAVTAPHKSLVKLLVSKGADINAKDKGGKTALHWAALEGHKDIARLLVIKGANVNQKEKTGQTPLHWAALQGHKDVVELLLINSGDINVKNDGGMTPMDLAASQEHQDVVQLLIEFLLRSARTIQDKIMLFSILERFGPNAVVPILKQYENPSSSKEQKDLAGMLILRLPDTESVIDRVVEAYKHGRYFETQEKKPDKDRVASLSFKEFLDEVFSWWGNMIKRRYKGNKSFVKYVAQKHLPNPYKQEAVIELLAGTDFRTASKYLESLDCNALSDKALDMLILMVGIPPTDTKEEDICLTERFSLFCKIFAEMEKNKREEKKLLHKIDDFPGSLQVPFIASNFKDFTEEEKNHALYVCSKLNPAARKRIYDSIKGYCSPMQIRMIEHYEKK